jgi:hypothetical protein
VRPLFHLAVAPCTPPAARCHMRGSHVAIRTHSTRKGDPTEGRLPVSQTAAQVRAFARGSNTKFMRAALVAAGRPWQVLLRSGCVAASRRGHAQSCDERHLVHVAPAPVLSRLCGADNRMARFARMAACVAVGRRVAAADLPACRAHSKVQPRATDLEALLASGDGGREDGHANLIEVVADGHLGDRSRLATRVSKGPRRVPQMSRR